MEKQKEDEKRILLNDFINITKEIISKYGKDKQLVSGDKPEIEKLLSIIEDILLFGLKSNSFFDNLQVMFTSSNSGNSFWNFAYQHLAKDEQKRFSSYKNLWTDKGRTKALIRNFLNEKCLERYFLTWLTAENIDEFYESYAIFRDEKAIAILPRLASDLSSILFAISIDIPELNVDHKNQPVPKNEPVIAVPNSTKTIKTSTNRRNIDSFEETVKSGEIGKLEQPNIPLSPPKYEPTIDYTVNVPNFCDTISISGSIMTKEDDTTSLSSSSSEEEVQPKSTTISTNQQVQVNFEETIIKQRERITELENKVLDLTIENSRLRNLLADSSNSKSVNSLGNFQIAIPRAVLNKTKTKNFYIYEINIRSKDENERWTIFKRYRDFYNFHKILKKRYVQIRVLDFPPKKNIGNLDFDFVEERRQRLQVYLRHVLQNLPELANCSTKQSLESKCEFFKS